MLVIFIKNRSFALDTPNSSTPNSSILDLSKFWTTNSLAAGVTGFDSSQKLLGKHRWSTTPQTAPHELQVTYLHTKTTVNFGEFFSLLAFPQCSQRSFCYQHAYCGWAKQDGKIHCETFESCVFYLHDWQSNQSYLCILPCRQSLHKGSK